MKRMTGVILIIAAIFFGLVGINKLDESEQSANFLGIFKFHYEDEDAKEVGYIFLGLAALLLIGGFMTMREK